VSRYRKWMGMHLRVSVVGMLVIVSIITIMALADKLFGLGFGYDWGAVIGGGAAVAVLSALIWIYKRAIA